MVVVFELSVPSAVLADSMMTSIAEMHPDEREDIAQFAFEVVKTVREEDPTLFDDDLQAQVIERAEGITTELPKKEGGIFPRPGAQQEGDCAVSLSQLLQGDTEGNA